MDPARIEREEPAWAARLERRHGPVQGTGAWKDLLRAIADDVSSAELLTPAALRNARLPILLVYGDRDVFVPADHAVQIYRQLPDARLLMAPDTPHQVMVSQPGLFNQAAATFYRSTEKVARERAESGAVRSRPVRHRAEGAALWDPAAVVAKAESESDPFSEW
jgi:pimeloyl-ACP methyl ester carboxylesterase